MRSERAAVRGNAVGDGGRAEGGQGPLGPGTEFGFYSQVHRRVGCGGGGT